jgi:crotonobetainyl-CoA:carnitine CoA-transferase CaiB-like acyl-CoA transferase
MILAVGNDGQFAKLAIVAGHPDWALAPEFSTNRARVENRAAFVEAFTAVSVTRTTKDWVSALEAAGVPCGPINTLKEVFEDPQVIARGTKITLPHPTGVDVSLVANPIRMSATPAEYRSAPPTLGQHTKQVLADRLGLSDEDIERLVAKGVV